MISVKFSDTIIISVWEGNAYKPVIGFVISDKSYIEFPIDDIIEKMIIQSIIAKQTQLRNMFIMLFMISWRISLWKSSKYQKRVLASRESVFYLTLVRE